MNNDTTKLKEEISHTFTSFTNKITALESKAHESLSLETKIAEHPLLAAVLSFGIGFVVGSQLPLAKKLLQPLAIALVTEIANEMGKKYLP